MRRIILATVFLSTAFFMSSCGAGGADPKTVLISFFEKLTAKDIEAAKKLATADSKSMLDMMGMGLKMSKDEKSLEKFDKTNMEFGETKIEGDKATVPVKEKTTGEVATFILKKEAGLWKVAFDMMSLMEMSTEKLKQHGEINADSLERGMDKLKNMNMDSVKKAMTEGMQALDSVQKMLKEINKN